MCRERLGNIRVSFDIGRLYVDLELDIRINDACGKVRHQLPFTVTHRPSNIKNWLKL